VASDGQRSIGRTASARESGGGHEHSTVVGEEQIESIDEASTAPLPALAPLRDRVLTMVAIILPTLGVVTAAFTVWGWGFQWVDLGLLLGMYAATMLAITVGFHRLFTHGAFETNRLTQLLFAVVGSMAVQGSLFHWVAVHRRHHQFSDKANDPHTPYPLKGGWRGLLKGIWHAHIGWFFEADTPNISRYVHDLEKSRALRVVSRLFPLWIVLGLALPAALGGWMTGTWRGALTGLIWGGLVRVFVVYHISWSINSACHLWGARPFESGDLSRNNFLFGVLAMGEGWHNTHHAFPNSARHGLRWWQLDASYWLIKALSWMKLAWNLRLPSEQAQTLKRRLAPAR